MDCLKEISNLYSGKINRESRFQQIDKTYIFTTENIGGYMPDLCGKKVLTVAASGDHYFNAKLNGADLVDIFDINYMTKFMIHLKIAAIINLDYDVFCTFFGLFDIYKIFNYELFVKFSKYLEEETFCIWNYIYNLTKQKGYDIYESDIVSNFNINEVIMANNYLTEEQYLKLKKIISNNPKVNFIHSDIKQLSQSLSNNYDAMFFSNINLYERNSNYIKSLRKLMRFLNKDGKMYFAYLYSDHNLQSDFFDRLLVSESYTREQIPSISNSNEKDRVYIYHKN